MKRTPLLCIMLSLTYPSVLSSHSLYDTVLSPAKEWLSEHKIVTSAFLCFFIYHKHTVYQQRNDAQKKERKWKAKIATLSSELTSFVDAHIKEAVAKTDTLADQSAQQQVATQAICTKIIQDQKETIEALSQKLATLQTRVKKQETFTQHFKTHFFPAFIFSCEQKNLLLPSAAKITKGAAQGHLEKFYTELTTLD